jgi:hypothetical protein
MASMFSCDEVRTQKRDAREPRVGEAWALG